MMGAYRSPSAGNGVFGLIGHDNFGSRVFSVCSKEGIAVSIKSVYRGIHCIQCIVITTLTVFGLMIDSAALHLDFTGREITLEVGHVVHCIP